MNAFAAYPNHLASPAALDREVPREFSRRSLQRRALFALGLVIVAAAIVTLLPGLTTVRERLVEARPSWLLVGIGLKALSCIGFVAIFRVVFARALPWRRSFQIGFSELAANALLPTGGAGGLALGAWALRRQGMPAGEVARRTVAFFLLTSVANVVALALIGLGLAVHVLPGQASPALAIIPAAVAILAVAGALGAGRAAACLRVRLERPGRRSRRAAALAKPTAAVADGVEDAVALLRQGNPALIAGMIAYLFFDLLLLLATFRAFGTVPPVAIVWIAYLIGELGGLIPVPGGIGGVDLGLVGALALYDVPIAHAASAVLAYRAIALWVPALLGAPAFVALRRSLREPGGGTAVSQDLPAGEWGASLAPGPALSS